MKKTIHTKNALDTIGGHSKTKVINPVARLERSSLAVFGSFPQAKPIFELGCMKRR